MTTNSDEKRVPPTKLALENPHPRDAFIEFDEGPHIYTVHGEQGYTSVTTWNHQHFSHFDADAILDKMMVGRNMRDPAYKYYGMTREQIKDLWEKNRISASGSGTQMHNDIEKYYNDVPFENDSVEFQYFRDFVADFPELKPYRTEWMVYHEELKLSGSIDMVYENPDGTLLIYDWKRAKEIKHEDEYGKSAMTACISHLPDTNYWHYCLQLNTYKAILEEKYGKKVTGLYLVCLHPDNVYKKYERIEVRNLSREIKELFELRKRELALAIIHP